MPAHTAIYAYQHAQSMRCLLREFMNEDLSLGRLNHVIGIQFDNAELYNDK